MTVFELESTTVHALTDALRADADRLNMLVEPPLPTKSSHAFYNAIVTTAIDDANTRAGELRTEARRIAAVMDLTVDAAANVDAGTCARLEAAL